MSRSALLFAVVCTIVCASVSCSGGASTSSPSAATTSASSAVAPFAGTWTSATLPSGAADLPGCTGVTYTVTPTGASTATIAYTATCAGVAVSGTGNGTVNGSTLNWTTVGNAGGCAFSLGGTAVQAGASDLSIVYSGTVCGI